MLKRVCPICGKEFETTEKIIANGRGKYCSRECQFASMKRQVEVKCSICGKTFPIKQSKVATNKTGVFRCPECTEQRIRKNDKICPVCGKPFHHSKLKYCCKECAKKGRIKKGNDIIIVDNHAEIIINSRTYGEVRGLIDIADIELVKKHTWQVKKTKWDITYIVSSQCKKKEIKLHRYLMQCPQDKIVDHINHNGLDNRRENLRICTPHINATNIRRKVNNTTGFTGIQQCQNGRWKAVWANRSLGVYDTKEEAIFMREQYLNKFVYKTDKKEQNDSQTN